MTWRRQQPDSVPGLTVAGLVVPTSVDAVVAIGSLVPGMDASVRLRRGLGRLIRIWIYYGNV